MTENQNFTAASKYSKKYISDVSSDTLIRMVLKKTVDLIEERDSETVSNWLKKFKNITTISRDGSNTYKSAIENTNPEIIQVSDRFHLIKLVSETLVKYVKREYSKNIILTEYCVTGNEATCQILAPAKTGTFYVIDDDGTDYAYWMLNARTDSKTRGWVGYYNNYGFHNYPASYNAGARAVIEINK